MSPRGIDGETTDAGYEGWAGEGGSGNPPPENPAPKTPQTPKQGGGIKPSNIVLVGMMLAAIAGMLYLALHHSKNPAPDQEEIVLEPEVVSLDDGSVKLDAIYDANGVFGMRGQGEDEIGLTIVKQEGSTDLYDVEGTFNSNQNLGIEGSDKGQSCWIDITHEVKYLVNGTFSSSKCQFELFVSVAPISSQLVGTGCSVDLNLDPSALYLTPLPVKLVFTKALASQKSGTYSLSIFDVALPRGVNCPSLSNP